MSKYVQLTMVFESLIADGVMDEIAVRDAVKEAIDEQIYLFKPDPDAIKIEILDTENEK